MKQIDFNANREHVRWDQWQAFHIGVSARGIRPTTSESWHMRGVNFIVFDTGEAVCAPSITRPWARGYFPDLDVDLILSRDRHDQFYTPEGRLVPRSWLLEGGSQLLVIDRETKRVVHCNPGEMPATIPDRFRKRKTWPRVGAYFPGPGLPPIGCAPLSLAPPIKECPKEQREKYEEIVCPARAMLTFDENHPVRTGCNPDGSYYTWKDANRWGVLTWTRIMQCNHWHDLTDGELNRLYHYGTERWKVPVDYLLTEKP